MPHDIFDDDIGCVILPSLVSAAEVEEVLDACAVLLDAPPEQRRPRDRTAGGTLHLSELDERIVLVDSIVGRHRLTDVVGKILGPVFHRDEVAYRSPQPSFGGQMLHADDPPKLASGPATVATALVTLTDFTVSNGATRLVPGSHHRRDLQRLSGTLESHDDEISLTGPCGTAFVFSGHVLHSGTTNHSAQERPALHLVWRR